MATKEAAKFAQGVVNPKAALKRRMAEAGDDVEEDPKKGVDKGNLPGDFQMTQSQFSGYDKKKK